jgi:hypothetical protein
MEKKINKLPVETVSFSSIYLVINIFLSSNTDRELPRALHENKNLQKK